MLMDPGTRTVLFASMTGSHVLYESFTQDTLMEDTHDRGII